MSWKEDREVAEKRLEFVRLLQDGRYSMTELCDRFGIARSNGYKWVDRYLEAGLDGLKDLRRGPRESPLRTPQEVEALILAERDRHRNWGPQLLAVLTRDVPDVEAGRLRARSMTSSSGMAGSRASGDAASTTIPVSPSWRWTCPIASGRRTTRVSSGWETDASVIR
jgi:transposase